MTSKQGPAGAEQKGSQKKPVICGVRGPGPKYKLRTLVGYAEHCPSKLRNPAFSMAKRQLYRVTASETPGPKYSFPSPKRQGFSFGLATKYRDCTIGPGPKYRFPDVPHTPLFSMRWRTGYRKIAPTPAPYMVKSVNDAPAYSLGLRIKHRTGGIGPGPQSPGNLDMIRPKAPMYTMGHPGMDLLSCGGTPGPKYNPKVVKSSPLFSFGIRHSECAPPYITECDDLC